MSCAKILLIVVDFLALCFYAYSFYQLRKKRYDKKEAFKKGFKNAVFLYDKIGKEKAFENFEFYENGFYMGIGYYRMQSKKALFSIDEAYKQILLNQQNLRE